jgi:hypothetical protein
MNAEKKAAEERLLESSLRSLLGRVPGARRQPARSSQWLAAACLALGLGVVGASMWLQRDGRGSDPTSAPAQDPESEPLPDELSGDATTLSSLPADAQNLNLRLSGPRELDALVRFPHLRRLQVQNAVPGVGDTANAPRWSARSLRDAPDALAALTVFRELEVLELPHEFVLRPDHLRPLRELPRLRTIAFHGGLGCDAALGDALAHLVALRGLRIVGSKVDAAFFDELASAPLLELKLLACPGLDADAWHTLGRLRTLRHLEVTCQHAGTIGIEDTTCHLGTLGNEAFDAFAALPALRALLLDESDFDDSMLSRLPEKLELLDLGDRPMQSSLTAAALRRLGGLRDLTFGCGLDADAAIALIGTLRLRRLDYRGRWFRSDLLGVIAAQPDLIELSLRMQRPRNDFAPLTNAPRLESLRLLGTGGSLGQVEQQIPVDDLKLLRDCKALRKVQLVNCGFGPSVASQLGPAIRVEVTEYL